MKIIDLLVKIANGEENTKVKTKYDGFDWKEKDFLFSIYKEFSSRNNAEIVEFLNDYVEIIEEDKKFEDIREIRGEVERDKTLSHDENQDSIVKNFNMLIKWVNLLVRNQKRIINEINKLKGEK